MLHDTRPTNPVHPRETLRILSLTEGDKKPPQEAAQRPEKVLPSDSGRKAGDRDWM
jgi:hypothetical protein